MSAQRNLQSITIPYDDANLRFWRNTSVANLQPGQTATLTKNYLGYEWDEAPDNGFDPAGLVRLSSTTLPVNTYLLDYGNTTGNGTATHNLTLYRAPSGALVFGAGTVYWSWGLSDNHDLRSDADRSARAAGDGQPVRRHGHPAGDAAVRADRRRPPSTDHTAPTSTINALGDASAQEAWSRFPARPRIWRRRDRRRRGLDRRRSSWHPATGDENVDLYLVAAGCRHLHHHVPRRRRQHQSGNALGRTHGDRQRRRPI